MNRSSVTSGSRRQPSSPTRASWTRTYSLALVLAGSLLAGGNARTESTSLRWDNQEVFLPEIFPEQAEVNETEIFLSGLEALFPRRVFREEPVLESRPEREPRMLTLVDGVPYIRIYNLASALPLIEEMGKTSTLVIDLRYIEADLDSSLAFGSLLASEGSIIGLTTIGDHPVASEARALQATGRRTFAHPFFVLTNGETAGPVEVVLSALKENGHIISVGGPTAGKTGSFRQVSENPSFYVMNGEIRANAVVSLVETGFIPAVLSQVPPEEDREAYQALENGVSIERLVQPLLNKARYDEAQLMRDFNNGEFDSQEPTAEVTEERDVPIDSTLQRVYHIVKALQSLGRIPQN